jgi:hypothetical protein
VAGAAGSARDLSIVGIGPYRLAPGRPGGLIFGYSDLGVSAIRHGVDLLARVIDDLGAKGGR